MDLQISALQRDYRSAARSPKQVVEFALSNANQLSEHNVWISRVEPEQIFARLEVVLQKNAEAQKTTGHCLPLFGVPFAVKDNIDVAGVPTTAACPSFSHTPTRSATAVELLEAAGAILIGKTNMDQFATGLVGTRSPYGSCSSAFNQSFISGGSSSGSALAVAHGCVSFALGTDTAGSGRVPAGFNNIFGIKPTKGLISTRGVLPACRSLDVVSIFAGNANDGLKVLNVAACSDEQDAYCRQDGRALALEYSLREKGLGAVRIGVLPMDQREFFGDDESALAYAETLETAQQQGASLIEVDFTPFREAAELLYSGAWVAERTAAVGEFLAGNPPDADPSVHRIITGGSALTAVQAFQSAYRLEELRRLTEPVWKQIDVLLLPTAPRPYTHDEVAADPLRTNSNLGYYTNFVNLLDLCALALPAGMKPNGMPFGVTLLGPAFADNLLVGVANHFSRPAACVGSTNVAVETQISSGTEQPVQTEEQAVTPDGTPLGKPSVDDTERVLLTVVGAHLRGQPLHHQLTDLRAQFVEQTTTAPNYRLFALHGTVPPKPGLVRTATDNDGQPASGSRNIEVEVYSLGSEAFGEFTNLVPPPLAIGNVELADGRWVKGFVCEAVALDDATEITHHGGWRKFVTER